MAGGAHRGPLGLRRQRRTIRFVQLLLVATGIGLAAFALATVTEIGREPQPGTLAVATRVAQPIVLSALALGAWGGAWLLADGRGVRIPTPARLEELAGRAEAAAIVRAQEAASQDD